MNGVLGTLQIWSVFDPDTFNCYTIELILNVTFQFCKLCIYAIFILRIQLAFAFTAYAYNKYIISLLYLFILSYFIISVVLQIINLKSDWMYSPDTWCKTYFPGWLVAMILSCDIIISVLTLIMFIRPLRILLKQIDGIVKDNAFHILISKYLILSTVAILSTLIGFIGTAAFGWTILLGVDDMINVSCIVLITTIHDRDYRWLCKCWFQQGCCCGCCNCLHINIQTVHVKTRKFIIRGKKKKLKNDKEQGLIDHDHDHDHEKSHVAVNKKSLNDEEYDTINEMEQKEVVDKRSSYQNNYKPPNAYTEIEMHMHGGKNTITSLSVN